MSYHVFSTLTCDVEYAVYSYPPKDEKQDPKERAIPQKIRGILIKGGTNVRTIKQPETPVAVKTVVNDEDMEILKNDKIFQLHCKNGFITYFKHSHSIEKIAKDMKDRDQSAPLTPKLYEAKKHEGIPQPYRSI